MKISGKEVNFKPEFGNENHTKISVLLARIDKNWKRLISQKEDTTAIKNSLKDDKREVVALLKLDRYQKSMK